MMKKILISIIVGIVLISSLTGFVSISSKGDDSTSRPRNVLFELFTATWCTGCPYADTATEQLKVEYGERISLLQYHIWDDGFDTPEIDARAEHYDAASTSIPALWTDGVDSRFGAESKDEAYNSYKSILESRLALDSPLELEITYTNLTGDQLTLSADLAAVASLPQNTFNVRFVIYENRLHYDVPQPNTEFNYVVRDYGVQSVTTTSLPATLTQTFVLNSSWNYSNMGTVVFAQIGDSGEVLQSHSVGFGIADVDEDGLPDDWEMLKLKTLLYSGEDDPDGDNITNLEEYLNHTDPLKKEAVEDSIDGYVWLGLTCGIIVVVTIMAVLTFRRRGRGKSGEEHGEEQKSSK